MCQDKLFHLLNPDEGADDTRECCRERVRLEWQNFFRKFDALGNQPLRGSLDSLSIREEFERRPIEEPRCHPQIDSESVDLILQKYSNDLSRPSTSSRSRDLSTVKDQFSTGQSHNISSEVIREQNIHSPTINKNKSRLYFEENDDEAETLRSSENFWTKMYRSKSLVVPKRERHQRRLDHVSTAICASSLSSFRPQTHDPRWSTRPVNSILKRSSSYDPKFHRKVKYAENIQGPKMGLKGTVSLSLPKPSSDSRSTHCNDRPGHETGTCDRKSRSRDKKNRVKEHQNETLPSRSIGSLRLGRILNSIRERRNDRGNTSPRSTRDSRSWIPQFSNSAKGFGFIDPPIRFDRGSVKMSNFHHPTNGWKRDDHSRLSAVDGSVSRSYCFPFSHDQLDSQIMSYVPKAKLEGDKGGGLSSTSPGDHREKVGLALAPSPCKTGPSTLTVGGMSNRGKTGPVAKKVMPPTVPDGGGSSSSSTCSSISSSHRHSGSSLSSGVFSSTTDQRASFTSSLGEDSNPPPSPRSPTRDNGCDHGMLGTNSGLTCNGNNGSGGARLGSVGSSVNSNANNASPSHYHNSQFTFPPNHQVPQFAHLMCQKASPGSPHHMPSETNYTYLQYQHQGSMEDQGIDVQSPGRSSPGSGSGSSTTGSTTSSGNCRNSTTSLDSGRASSSTHTTGTHTHRLSGQSYDSGTILRHSYHSSSSSLGSTETEGAAHTNVHELIKNGVPDSEVLRVWLCELHFEEYYDKFLSAGYDMPTISRMTPEDLNAIGITKPAHRKKLKAEISRLNISDGLPDYIPSLLEEWFRLLRLDTYTDSLKAQNYNTVEQLTQITWEDLEDVGITKLGHQKKVMLAIKRVKDIKCGKKFTSGVTVIPYSNGQDIIMGRENSEAYMTLNEMRSYHNNQIRLEHQNRLPTADPGGHFHPPSYPVPPYRYPPGIFPPDRQSAVLNPTLHYRPDLVAVNIRQRGRASQEPIYGTYQTFVPEHRFPPTHLSLPPRPILPLQNGPQRSFDDGDITPTNEVGCYEGGGGTLPRPRTATKYRPVAKVTAKTRVDIHDIPKFAKEKSCEEKDDFKKIIIPQGSASTNNTPQGTPKKKLPPPLPRRSNSISESSKDIRRGTLPPYDFKNNLQPDMIPNMPPPPPAPQDRGNHQHLMGDFPPPPPPLTCLTLAKRTSNLSSSSSDSTPYNSDSEIMGFRPRRNESNSSFKSNSSTDSGESLPFANDNAGTIKQRTTRPHPVGFPLLVSSPRSSPLSSPALRRKEGIVHPTIRQPSLNAINNNNHPNAPAQPVKTASDSSTEGTGDVLSDIGNMLATLTDELDAMLEQELSAKT